MKDLVKRAQGTYIIVEDDEPTMVVLSFEQYEKLINKKSSIQIAGNIHESIVRRANESFQKATKKRAQEPLVQFQDLDIAQNQVTESGQNLPQISEEVPVEQQVQAPMMPLMESAQERLFSPAIPDQEFSPAPKQ